jgi:hypothetical protein
MTTPDERTRAVVQTCELLRALLDPAMTPDVPAALRDEARSLLRHYPTAGSLRIAHLACPQWFGPPDAVAD